MAKIKEYRSNRKRKRRFAGNRYMPSQNQKEGRDSVSCSGDAKPQSESLDALIREQQTIKTKIETASSSKLEHSIPHDNQKPCEFDNNPSLTGFRFVDAELLIDFIQSLLCPKCKRPLGESKRLSHVTEQKSVLASSFVFHCQCEYDVTLRTSKQCGKTSEVSRRFQMSVMSIGRNLKHAKKLIGSMNMPYNINPGVWYQHKEKIATATATVAEQSKHKAASEVKLDKGRDITVSNDGTWQRKGFQSKNGVVTTLSVNGNKSKVIDTHVLSNHCDGCAKMKKKLTEDEFERWFEGHEDVCEKNHNGSAGAMETAGTEVIFRRSVELHDLRYTGFLGDGDSKSYSCVEKAEPAIYDDNTHITKYECCGHVQKRMGKQLINKVAELKQKTFVHNANNVKGIGGKGGLTMRGIKTIQGHYGAAIRKNVEDVDNMHKDIWSIWEHRTGEHDRCGGWCPSKKNPPTNPNSNTLRPYITEAIKPVFEKLSRMELLEKCAHGGTQNTNESFHNVIWARCPKTSFVGRSRLCLAVDDATICYNDGESGRLPIFTELGMVTGHHTTKCFLSLDKKRLSNARAQAAPEARLVRQRKAIDGASAAAATREYYEAGAN